MLLSELQPVINEKFSGNEKAYVTHALQDCGEHVSAVSEAAEAYCASLPPLIEFDVPFPPPSNTQFTFIDLFAGIGGFRIPAQQEGGKCVFTSEFNHYAQEVYEANFGDFPFGDITKFPLGI